MYFIFTNHKYQENKTKKRFDSPIFALSGAFQVNLRTHHALVKRKAKRIKKKERENKEKKQKIHAYKKPELKPENYFMYPYQYNPNPIACTG